MFGLGFSDQSSSVAPQPAAGGKVPPSPVGPADPRLLEEESESVGDEMSMAVMAILPWGVSVILHAGLVLLAFFMVWSISKKGDDEDEPLVAGLTVSSDPGGPVSMSQAPMRDDASAGATRVLEQSPEKKPTTSTVVSKPMKTMGVAGGANRTNPFGDLGTGAGPNRGLFGQGGGGGGNFSKHIYVIDASGSLIDTLPFVIKELEASVQTDLTDAHHFTVLFFQDNQFVEFVKPPHKPPGLVPAKDEVKKALREWLASGVVAPRGATTPLPAIEKALSYAPQVVYLLSDNITGRGRFSIPHEDLVAAVKRANRAGAVINTIQFLYPDWRLKEGKKETLREIADMTGGTYKYFTARELQLPDAEK